MVMMSNIKADDTELSRIPDAPSSKSPLQCFNGALECVANMLTDFEPDYNICVWIHDSRKTLFRPIAHTHFDASRDCSRYQAIDENSSLGQEFLKAGEQQRASTQSSGLAIWSVILIPGKERRMAIATLPDVRRLIVFDIQPRDPTRVPVDCEQLLLLKTAQDIIAFLNHVEIELQKYILQTVTRRSSRAKSWPSFIRSLEAAILKAFCPDECRIVSPGVSSAAAAHVITRVADTANSSEFGYDLELFERCHFSDVNNAPPSRGSFMSTRISTYDEDNLPSARHLAICLYRTGLERPFLPHDESLLAFFADVCRTSFYTWLARAEMKHELTLERSFKAIIEAVYRAEDPEDGTILQEIVAQAVKVFGGDSGSLLLKTPGQDHLKFEKGVGYESIEGHDLIIPFDKGLCGYAARHTQTVAVADVTTDSRYEATLPDVRSEICAPIVSDGDCIGVINIDSKKAGHFQAEDTRTISALETFAKQAAVALTRARLFKETEDFRKQIAKTTQLLTASSIASGLAHELKNGLLTISTLAQGLEPDLSLKMKDENRRRLEDIRGESKKLSNMALRLMDLSRVGDPRKTITYLNRLVDKRLRVLDDFVRVKEMKLVPSFDTTLNEPTEGKGHPIFVDESQIEQVLTNLILNAIDASRPGQRIEVDTKNLSPKAVSFSVRDFGTGISAEDKSRVFDMFVTTKRDGFGVGLPVVKILIEENHAGRIEVDTKPGRGTSFEIILPKFQG
jgi:signal transduction histidine kinase